MRALKLTDTQKWFALFVVIVALVVGFWTTPSIQQDSSVNDEVSPELAVPVAQTLRMIDLQQDAVALESEAAISAATKAIAEPVIGDQQAVVNDSVEFEAWQIDNRRAPTPSITLNEKIVDYAVVEIEQNPAAYPQVGEEVVLPMLNGEKVVATVETSVVNPNGDYTWRGHLQGHGDAYPIVMTYGSTSVMATITTPAGSYSMTTVKGLGWLYKNPAEVELVDNLRNDFLEPPHDHFHDEHE